ncbi:MAG: hypothetical protein FWC79_02680 [Oscillospiraceae bacterium]|nr:hypothetical protein [Oscillospiraceae bacterium]
MEYIASITVGKWLTVSAEALRTCGIIAADKPMKVVVRSGEIRLTNELPEGEPVGMMAAIFDGIITISPTALAIAKFEEGETLLVFQEGDDVILKKSCA